MVIADGTMSKQDFVNHLLAIDSIFQSPADIDVVVGRVADKHREGVVHIARNFKNIDVDVGVQQLYRFEVDTINGVNLAGHDRIDTGRGVTNKDLLNFCKITTVVGVPVLVKLGDHGTDARLECHNLVRTSSDAIGDSIRDLACWEHTDVVVGDKVREVGTAAL